MTRYEMTEHYWNKVFDEIKVVNPEQPIKYAEIEEGIKWLVHDSKNVIDFGCGSGRVLLRAVSLGLTSGLGIDLSCKAIELAKKNADVYHASDSVGFKCGGVEVLRTLPTGDFDGAILFNIIDNMYPSDAMEVIKSLHKLLKFRGRVLMKLNPHYPESHFIENRFYRKIMDHFYLESSGLYLWNMSYEDVEDFLNPYFIIEDYRVINIEDHGVENRLFYLRAM